MTISKRSDKAGETARSGDTTIDLSQDLINHAIEKWRQRHASAVKWGDRGCHSTVFLKITLRYCSKIALVYALRSRCVFSK